MDVVGADYSGTFDTFREVRENTDLIVTGKSWTRAFEVTETDIPVFFNPDPEEHPELSSVIAHKSGIIKKAKITKYYENDAEQVSLLKMLCPECKIIKV